MAAFITRNLPDDVHETPRRTPASRHVSVESLARQALTELAAANRPAGIDFAALTAARAAAGLHADGPAWTEALDDPALSRDVLGLA